MLQITLLTANGSTVLRFLRLKIIFHNISKKLYINGKKFHLTVRSEAWVLITSQLSHSRPSTVVKLA